MRQTDAFVSGQGHLDEDLKNIPDVYDRAGGVFLIAEWEGTFVGMGALRRVDERTAEIKRMRVQPMYQGRGIGTALLRRLEENARAKGYRRLILDTSTRQQAALHLYAKHGYREYRRGGLGGLETVWMEKDL